MRRDGDVPASLWTGHQARRIRASRSLCEAEPAEPLCEETLEAEPVAEDRLATASGSLVARRVGMSPGGDGRGRSSRGRESCGKSIGFWSGSGAE